MSGGEQAVRPGRFFLGCAVWAHGGWLGGFYPTGARPERYLDLYAERLTAVEGNTTFYSVPDETTLRSWRSRLPEGFRFLPKLPRSVTHEGALVPRAAAAESFAWHMAALGSRLGPIFAQLPPTSGIELEEDLIRFLETWPRGAPPLLLELRNTSWYGEEVRTRLEPTLAGLGVGRVVLDTRPIYEHGHVPQERRKPRLPVIPRATARTAMLRLVGNPDTSHNGPYIDQWATRIDTWLRQGRDVYAFAHCPVEDHSPGIARALQGRLEQLGAPVPPLPWAGVRQEEQLDLFESESGS